jgi:hypothetical protein
MKTCPLCSTVFVPRTSQVYCRSCIVAGEARRDTYRRHHAKHAEARRACSGAWRKKNPARVLSALQARLAKDPSLYRRARLKSVYGLSISAYDSVRLSQGGTCAICHRPPPAGKPLYVDHDHTSGKVRSLLCRACNTAVGLMETSEVPLIGVISYVLRHRQEAQYDLPPSKDK